MPADERPRSRSKDFRERARGFEVLWKVEEVEEVEDEEKEPDDEGLVWGRADETGGATSKIRSAGACLKSGQGS